MGKGDTQRPTDKKSFDKNYIEIFGDKGCTLSHKHTKECKKPQIKE